MLYYRATKNINKLKKYTAFLQICFLFKLPLLPCLDRVNEQCLFQLILNLHLAFLSHCVKEAITCLKKPASIQT